MRLQLEQLLPTAAFVAIDEEMTGIHLVSAARGGMAESMRCMQMTA